MGNDMLQFVDTDLHDMKPADLMQTLESRIGTHLQMRDWGTGLPDIYQFPEGWSLWCSDADIEEGIKYHEVILGRRYEDCSFSLWYNNHSFSIREFELDGVELNLQHHRFNLFCRFLSEYTSEILHDLRLYIDAVNRYIKPITNCRRLFMCGDQVYIDENEWWNLRLEEDGLSFDELIEMNSKAREPETVYTWDNLDILMKEYVDWGMFFFDLEKLPDYLK